MKETKIYKKELYAWEKSAKFHKTTLSHPFRQFLWQKILKTYNLSKNERSILEIGCGVGYFISLLSKERKNITGVDFSQNMLKIAKKTSPQAKFIQASADNLPFKNHSFDSVITNMLLHHLKAQGILSQGVKEIHRVLRPGGAYYVFDHKDNFASNFLLALFNFGQGVLFALKRNLITVGTTSEVMFTKEDIKEIIDNGFRLEKTTNLITVPYHLLEVTSNGIGYLFGYQIGLKAAYLLFPLAKWTEERLNLRWLQTEQCLKFKKT